MVWVATTRNNHVVDLDPVRACFQFVDKTFDRREIKRDIAVVVGEREREERDGCWRPLVVIEKTCATSVDSAKISHKKTFSQYSFLSLQKSVFQATVELFDKKETVKCH